MNEASKVYECGGAGQGEDERYFHYLIQKAKLAYLGPCSPSLHKAFDEKLCCEKNELIQPKKKAKFKCEVLQLSSKETVA